MLFLSSPWNFFRAVMTNIILGNHNKSLYDVKEMVKIVDCDDFQFEQKICVFQLQSGSNDVINWLKCS